MLFPHIQYTMMQQLVAKASLEKWASLLHKVVSFMWMRGNLVNSRKMGKKAIKIMNNLFGARNEKTLRTSNILGLVYSLGGE